jgi:hypothetical protein
MATERPETIDAASACGPKRSEMPGRQLSCLARNGRSPGKKLNAGIAARRSRRSRCSARSGHRRDPNGACSRNRESQGEQANITDTGPQDKAACKSSSHSQATSRSPKQWEPNAAPSHLDRPEPEDWFQSVSAFRAHLMQIMSASPGFDLAPIRTRRRARRSTILIRSRRGTSTVPAVRSQPA